MNIDWSASSSTENDRSHTSQRGGARPFFMAWASAAAGGKAHDRACKRHRDPAYVAIVHLRGRRSMFNVHCTAAGRRRVGVAAIFAPVYPRVPVSGVSQKLRREWQSRSSRTVQGPPGAWCGCTDNEALQLHVSCIVRGRCILEALLGHVR